MTQPIYDGTDPATKTAAHLAALKPSRKRWLDDEIDADPYLLPAKVTIPAQGLVHRATGFLRYATVYKTEVAVADSSPILGVWNWTAKISEFEGVAMRIAYRDRKCTGEPIVVVELRHAHPDNSVILHVSFDGNDAAARWRSWANVLGLPALVESKDGEVRHADARLGSIIVGDPQPHRGASLLTERRPQSFGFTGRPRHFTDRLETGNRPLAYGRNQIAAHF